MIEDNIERFFSKVKYSDDCWDWTGGYISETSKYGIFYYNGKRMLAHRFSYLLFNGNINNNLYICHHCDNRKCVNPFHLFEGTTKDNMRDASEKKRLHNQKKTHCPKSHEYTNDNTLYRSDSRRSRICRECHTQNAKNWRTNNPEKYKEKTKKQNEIRQRTNYYQEYREKNREKIREYDRKWKRKKIELKKQE